jgi:hypothetical protein
MLRFPRSGKGGISTQAKPMYNLGQYLSAHKDANTLTTDNEGNCSLNPHCAIRPLQTSNAKHLNKLPSKGPRMRRSSPVLWRGWFKEDRQDYSQVYQSHHRPEEY